MRRLRKQTVSALKARAAARGNSLEEELRQILTEAARPTAALARATAAAIRALGAQPVTADVEALVRDDRGR
ncbi:MAG: hypothetical protein OES32_18165 [Acidobacteriota bacterium]|nr:hypothetical protein [Acidobacteriota bacterium]